MLNWLSSSAATLWNIKTCVSGKTWAWLKWLTWRCGQHALTLHARADAATRISRILTSSFSLEIASIIDSESLWQRGARSSLNIQRRCLKRRRPTCFFRSQTEIFLKWPKKLNHFGQNVWKYRLKITVMVSFNATVRQMTEMFQCRKHLGKKWPKCFSEKKTAPNYTLKQPENFSGFKKKQNSCFFCCVLSFNSENCKHFWENLGSTIYKPLEFITILHSQLWSSLELYLEALNMVILTSILTFVIRVTCRSIATVEHSGAVPPKYFVAQIVLCPEKYVLNI